MDRYAAGVLVASSQGTVAFRNPTANAWGSCFLRHLRHELAGSSQCTGQIAQNAQALFETHRAGLPDAAAHTVLGMCSLMQATYRGSSAALGSSQRAFELVERCLVATYQDFIQNICKPLLTQANHTPQALARMNFTRWSERMACTPEAAVAQKAETDGTGYQRCLRLLGEPALAEIIRRADQAWMDAVASNGMAALDARCGTRHGDRGDARNTGFLPFRFAAKAARGASGRQDRVFELQIHLPADRRGQLESAERRRHWSGIDRRRSSRRRDDMQAWQ